jgi:hypothetical protein
MANAPLVEELLRETGRSRNLFPGLADTGARQGGSTGGMMAVRLAPKETQ